MENPKIFEFFSIFLQVATSLPKTSYFKLVDVWLLFCIFSTFFIIVFHILIDFLHNRAHYIIKNTQPSSSREAAIGKPNQMIVLPERLFLSSAKVQGAQLEPLVHQQKLQEPQRSTSWKDDSGKDKNKVTGYSAQSAWATVSRVERFARAFMLVVFIIFNVIYWITAYAY